MTPLTPEESYRFLFVLLPRWEETGTVCPVCWPDGSKVSDPCTCTSPSATA